MRIELISDIFVGYSPVLGYGRVLDPIYGVLWRTLFLNERFRGALLFVLRWNHLEITQSE